MTITRIIVAPKKGPQAIPDVYRIINLETEEPIADIATLHSLFADGVTEEVIVQMPTEGTFTEVMHHNGVIDPQQDIIVKLCAKRGVEVWAVKVGYRYYGEMADGVYVNKAVHVAFRDTQPDLTTLRPRGVRISMQRYDLTAMNDDALVRLSKDRELALSLEQMRRIGQFQAERGLSNVTDVELETFGAFWSDHCYHILWKSLGLLKTMQEATERINNPNLVSAFVDNAGVWDFYDGLCVLFKLETHNSPTQKEPFGGQLTKLGGVIRDILACGLGAKPIGNIEMTTVGEFLRRAYPEFEGKTLSASTIARETVRAIGGYGNPMGIPMVWARMMSHPDFSGKPFALGGTAGLTTHAAANKGTPHKGDLVVMIGGRTGNDGLHGATISSGGISEQTDSGDKTHVQIGLPYTEQLMIRAVIEMRDAGCVSAVNDFGAAGIVSCFGEMGKETDSVGGIFINLALAKLKCAEMANWQIALSESQERLGYAIPPEKWEEAQAIFVRYGLEATVIGVFTDTGCFQMIYDAECQDFLHTDLSGEVCLDVPYAYFDQCPIAPVAIRAPTVKRTESEFPVITVGNVQNMAEMVVGHFDVCDQSWATEQYDHTVQGITFQGPLYGRRQNVSSSLGVLRPVYGKPYGVTVSVSFSPWQFAVDPVQAAVNAMMDVLVTQAVAGVAVEDIALADNFYTDGASPESLWCLMKQVEALTNLSILTGTPFITGKDSSSGRGTFGGVTAKVPPSVCITGLGKVPNVNRLVLHQWKTPGNKLVVLGPKAKRLDGSILASSWGLSGTKLDAYPYEQHLWELLRWIPSLADNGTFVSAVPINRGGILLRLFEGIEASGFGVETDLCDELFPESFGSVLVEVTPRDEEMLRDTFSFEQVTVGTILPENRLVVHGRDINLSSLRNAWQRAFKEALSNE